MTLEMVNAEIRFIMYFSPKDGEALYSLAKTRLSSDKAQIMNALKWSSDLNWGKYEKPPHHWGLTESKSLWLHSGDDK